MNRDIFQIYLDLKDNNELVKKALTDSSYNNYKKKNVRKNDPNYDEVQVMLPTNNNLSTIGDAIIKSAFSMIFYEDDNQLSEIIKPYLEDKYLVKTIGRHYDILKYLFFDYDDQNKPNKDDLDNPKYYDYPNQGTGERFKYIATAVEAMIAVIYLETQSMQIIKKLLIDWINF